MSSTKPETGPCAALRRSWSWRRTGARVFALQAVALILAFWVTGLLATLSIQRVNERAYRADVLGEVASLNDEQRQKSVDHLSHTVTKRSRLWHGFEYGLAGPGGGYLAGDPGLARLTGTGWTKGVSAKGRVLAYTERLPNGGSLTVGRDLSAVEQETRELTTLLAMSGLVGVAICLMTTYLTTRWTWRRLDRLSSTAALVAAGRLDLRAPVRTQRAPDEIDELSLAFNTMLDRIGRLVDQLRQVTRDVAHDMRKPMARLRQRLDRVGRSAQATPALRAEIERLDADFREILRTFDALLQLAEIEGRPRPDGRIDLADVAERVLEALRPDIEDGGRSLVASVRPAQIDGDPDLIAQALVNILENAARHTPTGSRIELRVEDGEAPRVVVRDNGPGIPADQRDTALAPLGRLEVSRSTPGSGLGLAIAASVAVRHGARLELADAAPGLEVSISFVRDRTA